GGRLTEPATALALGLGDLRGLPAQVGADRVEGDLDDGPLLALVGRPLPLQRLADSDHGRALVQRLSAVLGELAPCRAAPERRRPVLPMVAVLDALVGDDGEVGDRMAARRE